MLPIGSVGLIKCVGRCRECRGRPVGRHVMLSPWCGSNATLIRRGDTSMAHLDLRKQWRWVASLALAGTLIASQPNAAPVAARGSAATSLANDSWPYFGRDRNNTRFSPLTQV